MGDGGHEGWDSELFVEPPDEADLCGICCEVLEDAVETQCGHTFCEKCIRGWLKKREVCPQDQMALTWDDCRPMVRDRRRILDLKVKCQFDSCGEQMELRQLRTHQKNCKHKPDDWADPREYEQREEEPQSPVKAKPDDNEFVLELHDEKKDDEKKGGAGAPKDDVGAAQAAHRERVEKEQEDHDRAFALQMQMQEQERARAAQAQAAARNQARSVAVQPKPQPAVQIHMQPEPLELAPANDGGPYVDFYQAGGRAEGVGAGMEGAEMLRPPKKNRCCNDKLWCCFCCVFWIALIVIGGFIWIEGGVSGAKDALGG